MMKKNDAFILREIYGKNILMPVRKNAVGDTPIVLNNTAADVWKLIDGETNKNALIGKTCDLYGIKENSNEAELINDFINSLMEMKLIVE